MVAVIVAYQIEWVCRTEGLMALEGKKEHLVLHQLARLARCVLNIAEALIEIGSP